MKDLGTEVGLVREIACLLIVYTICQELYISIFLNLYNGPLRTNLPFPRSVTKSQNLSDSLQSHPEAQLDRCPGLLSLSLPCFHIPPQNSGIGLSGHLLTIQHGVTTSHDS